MTDTRERFLRDITAHVPADRIAEVHLFRPMRRGATETGVAVIAAEPADKPLTSDAPAGATHVTRADAAGTDDDSPYAAEPAPELPPERHTVFTARYRLTIKGAERGKWEFDVVADADAPLITVDTVVRGVQRRAGDDDAPERLSADGLRAALDGQSWRPTP